MDYAEIIRKSWQIVWKHKVLWIFGLMASCTGGSGGGGGGGGGGGAGGGSNNSGVGPGFQPFQNMPGWMNQIERFFTEAVNDGTIWLFAAGFFVIILTLICISLAVGTLGRTGLVRGAWSVDVEGKDSLTFRQLIRESLPYFWRVLATVLLFSIGVGILVIVIMAPLILLTVLTLGIGLILLIPFICLLVPVGFVLSMFEQLVIVSIVGKNRRLMESLRIVFDMIRKRPGSVLLMGLILLIGGGIAGILISLPFLLMFVPLVFTLITQTQEVLVRSLIMGGVIFLLYLPIAVLLGSILHSYLGVAWTLTYKRFEQLIAVSGQEGAPENLIMVGGDTA